MYCALQRSETCLLTSSSCAFRSTTAVHYDGPSFPASAIAPSPEVFAISIPEPQVSLQGDMGAKVVDEMFEGLGGSPERVKHCRVRPSIFISPTGTI